MKQRAMKMKTITSLVSLCGLLAPAGVVLAHGAHAAVPANSLLHLLGHHWPLLLAVIGIAGIWWLRRNPG